MAPIEGAVDALHQMVAEGPSSSPDRKANPKASPHPSQVREKCERQKEQFNAGGGRAGQNIREYLASVRDHNVVIDPTVMVSVMSVMVLEGWQTRLDPSVCIFDQLQVARGSGAFGMAQRAHELFMSVFGAWLS